MDCGAANMTADSKPSDFSSLLGNKVYHTVIGTTATDKVER